MCAPTALTLTLTCVSQGAPAAKCVVWWCDARGVMRRACACPQRGCSLLCLRQDGRRNVYTNLLSVPCPEWGVRGDSMPDTSLCGDEPASMVLLPAGERVTAVDSMREGEMCEWDPVGVPPSSPSLWAAVSGAVSSGPLFACALMGGKSTAIALALRRLLPVGWDRPLGP